jgi:RHS repeat-associated protein
VFAPEGAWQSDVSASKKCLGYEPFGALLPGRNYNSGSTRWGFNGKENDNEVHGATGTFQDYGMRAYDTRVGRFFSVDPIATKFPMLTPYQFAGNTPIWC